LFVLINQNTFYGRYPIRNTGTKPVIPKGFSGSLVMPVFEASSLIRLETVGLQPNISNIMKGNIPAVNGIFILFFI
jgi:hypothetical protein